MERKTTNNYSLVLAELKKNCEERNIIVEKVVSDYEAALRSAVRLCVLATIIVGCHCHYARAVYMRFKIFGLLRNPFEQKTLAIKMAMGVSLLPTEYFDRAIEIIRGRSYCLFSI